VLTKNKFFFQTLTFFQDNEIENKKMIVGVSSGIDSMVLIDLLKKLRPICKLKLYVSYIHHGLSNEKKITHYRNQAEKFISDFCKTENLSFLKKTAPLEQKSSEEAFRNFRHSQFKHFLKQKKADFIVLAHNENDLLETRLINLIRGCGKKGLQSMPSYDKPYLRPLLSFSRQDIEHYAKIKKINFIEDPSNKDNSYLRNWIRKEWLKKLEKKRKGSLKALARSLEALSGLKEEKLPLPITSKGIQRQFFLELNKKEQKRVLASYMRQLNLSNYGQSHMEELLKNNERKQKQFTIKLLKRNWFFSPDYITCKK